MAEPATPESHDSAPGATDGGVGLRALWRAFLEGLVRPSAGALIGTILIAGVMFGACITLITPRNLARIDMGYLMADNFDSYASITGVVFDHKYEGFSPNSLFIVGTSAMHHGFPPDPIVEAMVEKDLGEPVDVIPLYSDAVSTWEIMNIFGMFDDIPDGSVVVLGFNALSFARGADRLESLAERQRLPFVSDAFKNELRAKGLEVPTSTGNYFLDNTKFFAARIKCVQNIIKGPRRHKRGYDVRAAMPDPGRWERIMTILLERLEGYDENIEPGLEVVARLIDLIRGMGRNIHVVLVEPPLNPDAYPELNHSGILDRHAERMKRFAQEQGVPFWDVNEEARLDPADFADYIHLRTSPSRERWSGAMSERIAALFRENRVSAGAGGGAER